MAARSVFKLLTKTCPYPFTNSSSAISTLEGRYKKINRHRSFSQPNHSRTRCENPKEKFLHSRKLSRSVEQLRDEQYGEEVEEDYSRNYFEDRRSRRSYYQPPVIDMSIRQSAKEFKEKPTIEEVTEESNRQVYEVTDGTRDPENFFDVIRYMREQEREKETRLFSHLQPSSLKPYGSSENLYFTELNVKKVKIVYPMVNTQEPPRKKKVDNVPHKEYSSFRSDVSSSPLEEVRKVNVYETRSRTTNNLNRMKYSTTSLRRTLSKNSNVVRKSSSALLRDKRRAALENEPEALKMKDFYKRSLAYKEMREAMNVRSDKLINNDSRKNSDKDFLTSSSRSMINEGRYYSSTSTSKNKRPECEDYVKVKLGELEEQCRREKKCKPKKICFGKLPNLMPPDCPCIEHTPLKEGKPLHRLKKRFEPAEPKEPICEHAVCDTPRADANYRVLPKKLPVIKVQDCPCVEPDYIDLKIRRLPKKKVPEPPKICVECVGEECCPPRADANLTVRTKKLPRMEPSDCPCIEPKPLEDVPLARLTPRPIKEPDRVCPPPVECPPRADDDYKVKKKQLPILTAKCVCVEAPPMDEVPPLKRLKPKPVVERPKVCVVEVCDETQRADSDLVVKSKKLPIFVPTPCPCVEQKPPVEMKFKRLKKRSEPVERRDVCREVEKCPPRADEGMVIKPKRLPEIVPGDCPCIEPEMVDMPPLKKLVPKPVKEPEKICVEEVCDEEVTRSDFPYRVKIKSLPVLPPGSCPCVEPPPPLDLEPLRRLKKKPVKEKKRVCVGEDDCSIKRADENLKIEVKKLPKLQISDCPCIEPPPPEDIPLARLVKKEVPEPVRICPKVDDCEDIPRADEDDWMYWKRVEVKSPECEDPPPKKKEPKKKTSRKASTRPGAKRCFSTCVESKGRKFYSTSVNPEDNPLDLKYDLANIKFDQLSGKSYNLVIDIKPSAPLILTQTPIKVPPPQEIGRCLRRCNSAPIDKVTFVIYKSNDLRRIKSKDATDGTSVMFGKINRFISTCSTIGEHKEKDKAKDVIQTGVCECHTGEDNLQPRKQMLKEKEQFLGPTFPSEDMIEASRSKSRKYLNERKDAGSRDECKEADEEEEGEDDCKEAEEKALCEAECMQSQKELSLWQKILNYFKARPDCPSPEEFKKMRLRAAAEKAAAKAGLCLYDPKEILHKTEKDMPKVITASSAKEQECKK